MREKLLALMKNENLTPSKLAELLGIQPSGISHILGGRNKPSFDLIQKILRRFPQLNPDWLLLDKGPMYRATTKDTAEKNASPSSTYPALSENIKSNNGYTADDDSEAIPSSPSKDVAINHRTVNRDLAMDISASISAHGKVKRVIIFFEDRTFECYES